MPIAIPDLTVYVTCGGNRWLIDTPHRGNLAPYDGRLKPTGINRKSQLLKELACQAAEKERRRSGKGIDIGVRGFEPPTPSSQN
jgi:hypothetical protein